MGGAAGNFRVELIQARRTVDKASHRAGRIKEVAHFGVQLAQVHGLGAVEPRFLSHGKQDLQAGQGDLGGQHPAQTVENRAHAGDVVSGQNGGAVGVEHAVPLHGVNAQTFRHPVHVRAQQQRAVQLAFPHAQHIAALAAEGLAGIVRRNGKSQSFQLAHYQSGDGALLSGSGIGRNQFQQFRIHGFVFHCLPPKMSRENPRNIWNKVSFVNCP